MITIGIEEHSGHVFQRTLQIGWHPVWPTPILTQAQFAAPGEAVEMWTHTAVHTARYWFREITYDPISRIRRGLFYHLEPGQQPQVVETLPHPMPGELMAEPSPAIRSLFPRRLFTYHPLAQAICEPPFSSAEVLLGSAESRWKILSVEKINGDELLHTLKAKRSLGKLPELNLEKLPESAQKKAGEVYQALVDAAYVAGPTSVVDRARDAAQWLLAAWYAAKSGDDRFYNLDLQQLITKITEEAAKTRDKLIPASMRLALRPDLVDSTVQADSAVDPAAEANTADADEKVDAVDTVTAAAQIPARLHARKPHELHQRGLRPVLEEDAECALSCIGLMLREFDWVQE